MELGRLFVLNREQPKSRLAAYLTKSALYLIVLVRNLLPARPKRRGQRGEPFAVQGLFPSGSASSDGGLTAARRREQRSPVRRGGV